MTISNHLPRRFNEENTPSFQRLSNMLSTNYRNKIVDICCRMISTDGTVDLKERIWMNKLCSNNKSASALAGALLCPDYVPHDYEK